MIALAGATMQAQSPSIADATAVVARVFQDFEAGRWAEVAALVHRDGLKQFHTQQLQMAQAWQHMPAELAPPPREGRRNPGVMGFARVETLQELEALSPEEAFARWLEGHELKPENYDDGRPPLALRTILGAVAEGDSVVHVVYRIHTDVGRYGRTNETEVMTAKRSPAGWRVLINKDLSMVGYVEIVAESNE
jgi:hypothetical protein